MLTLSEYFQSIFGGRVLKIPISAALGCPNRSAGRECIYCDNSSFVPGYCTGRISEQLRKGMEFFGRKGAQSGYLAYFQSGTNTFGRTEDLIPLYEEALGVPGTVGLVIATRPDCLAPSLMDYFEERFGGKAPAGHPYLLVEIGVESTNDDTLRLIGRGHTFACAAEAVRDLAARGIAVGAHLIVGLPGEDEEDFIAHAERISALPVSTLKLHQLQILKGTPLSESYLSDPDSIRLQSPVEYARNVARMLRVLRKDIALDRFVSEAPKDKIIAPAWGIKPGAFNRILESELLSLDVLDNGCLGGILHD